MTSADGASTRPEVVVLGHDALRTGAAIFLLRYLRWASPRSDIDFRVVLLRGGPLEGAFEAVAPTTVVWARADSLLERARSALRAATGKAPRRLSALLERWLVRRLTRRIRGATATAAAVYANTIVAGEWTLVIRASCPVILNLHEMEGQIRLCASTRLIDPDRSVEQYLGDLVDRASRVVVPSDTARRDIERMAPDAARKVTVLRGPLELSAYDSGHSDQTQLKSRSGDATADRVVLAVGTTDFRKGPDLFIQLATTMIRLFRDATLRFVWLGAPAEQSDDVDALRLDARRAGVSEVVSFVPAVDDPAPFFSACDVFVSTSREDPYPLVALEAGLAARPIVCFSGTGTAEFVGDDAGVVVPYLDVVAMAHATRSILESTELAARCGTAARTKAQAHDIETMGERFVGVLEAVIDPTTTPAHEEMHRGY